MKKAIFAFTLLIVIFVFGHINTALSRHPSLVFFDSVPLPSDPLSFTPYPVVDTIDGDTIIINKSGHKLKIRLIGVDTPETVHPTKPVEHYGKEASRFIKNLLKGEYVYLLNDSKRPETDRYGRTLAYVYRAPDGLFVNAEIIRQGYGRIYNKFQFDYMLEFQQLEEYAREVQKGLWAETPTEHKSTSDTSTDIIVYVRNLPKHGLRLANNPYSQYYHRLDCRHLGKKFIPVTLDYATANKYFPCKKCKPPRLPKGK